MVKELDVVVPVLVCRVIMFHSKWKGMRLPFTLRDTCDHTHVSLLEK